MSPFELGIVGLTVLSVIGAVAWRRRSLERQRAAVRAAMARGTVDEVEEALDRVRRTGVADHAEGLVALIERPLPPDLARAVVELIAGHQWEPVVSDAQGRLRAWASEAAAQLPAPVHARRRSDGETSLGTPLVDRVEQALEEPVRWLRAETEEGTLVIDRDRNEEKSPWA